MLYYRQITPFTRRDLDRLKTEPYVYCGNIAGPEHKQFGYGRNAWLSGTASWIYVAATQWILGIRPTYHGLQVAPVIPDKWHGFKASRVFRGVRYAIEAKRVGKGHAVRLAVEGRAVKGSTVPFPPPGTTEVRVEVQLGRKPAATRRARPRGHSART